MVYLGLEGENVEIYLQVEKKTNFKVNIIRNMSFFFVCHTQKRETYNNNSKYHSRPFHVVNISYNCQLKFGTSLSTSVSKKCCPEVVFKFTCLLLLCYILFILYVCVGVCLCVYLCHYSNETQEMWGNVKIKEGRSEGCWQWKKIMWLQLGKWD